MFNVYLAGAIGTAAICLTIVATVNDFEHRSAVAVANAQNTFIMETLKGNAVAMCPGLPKDPIYDDLRVAYQCERFGL